MQAEISLEGHRDLPYFAVATAVTAWGLGPLFVRAISASAR